ncbi:MAG: hypothetical protein U9N77_15455 [Thermodesulfobacteriota bacterium]|nr:hypothetical protein [Thermodesulfobacteriota bacterium]
MKIFIYISALVLFGFLSQAVFAGDGFTSKDRDLLIELKVKMDQVDKRFDQVDRRFDQVDKRFAQVDKRFAQVDKRFDQVDKRFDQVDVRISELRADMNTRFVQMDKRFGQVDVRISELRADMNNRFVQMDRRFGQMINLIAAMIASFAGIVVATIGFALWDRKTVIKPVKKEIEDLKNEMAVSNYRMSGLCKICQRIADSDLKIASLIGDDLAAMAA